MSKARVSIAIIDARANTTYQLPITAINYIELIASAEVDTVGRHRYIVETAAVADQRAIDFAKNLSSLASTSDLLEAISLLKNLNESVETLETFEALLVTIVELFSEAFISDSDLIDFAKNLVDGVSIADLTSSDYLKPFQEELTSSDLFSAGFATSKSDYISVDGFDGTFNGETTVFNSIVFNEDLYRERITALFNKGLSESINSVDSYDRVIEWQKEYDDSVIANSLFRSDVEKSLSDIFTLADECTQQLIIERILSSEALVSDGQSADVSPSYSDAFNVGDSFSYEKIAAPPFLFNQYQFNTIRLNATI